ncbi:disease resistance protein RUN1 isoform X2 [Medicago truncatula]|uniref:disease resistance protein RUN1 isoform X2 n=1 Tax=Medicago truncatula TaxID=3880 RepID=UPI001966F654|nr:disease resistance protein RUN1 isoform X2 [Medicago truncatula]
MSSPRSLSSSDFSDFSDDIISSRTRKYDVFLSFRGEDTRASFTSHLTFSLQNAGIIVFKDDQSLERGEHISTSLLQAIEISRIAVIVFSKNYADSSWCLRELVQIMSCYSTIGQVVLPVFYDVDPSEVRRQTGDFGKSFQNLLNRISQEEERRVLKWNDGSLQRDDFPFSNKDMVRKWIDALHTAAGLAGFVVLNSRNESEVIRDIVENVTRLLDKTDLFIADNPVGVDSRVQDMIQLLETQQSNDALLLGMWGMGGIGKTTIAKSIYNKIGRNFEGIGISVLVERSLVTVDDKNKLGMHDLLRDMGREIIREKSPKEPEEHSRLWFHEDVIDVLLEHTGTKAVEGLSLKLPGRSAQRFSTKTFENMKKLRLLQLSGVQLDGDFKHLSRKLRWLQWNGFPLTCIPSNFYQRNLVSIVLENSNIRLVWKEMQGMEQLKILNLSHSQYLTQTPDFSYLPNLEKLVLKDCPRLSEISQSIGHLKKILLINLKDCISLCNLPRNIYTLKSLKTLILSGCSMIDTLEEDLEQMESLTTLIANNTGITKVPFSIVRSKRIGFISLCGYEGFSRDVFPSIISSWMSPTNGLSPTFQTTAGMSSLVFLNATNSISHDISSISYVLPKLQSLWLECGSELQLSQDTAIILNALSATNSKELESTATTSQVSEVKTSSLIECCDQMPDSATKNYMKSLLIQMGTSCLISNILKERILQNLTVDGRGSFLLPGDDYPNWLSFNAKGYSVIFEVPQVEGCSLKTIMCIVYSSSPYDITSDGLRNVLVINHTKTTIQLYKREALSSFENADWQRVISNMEPGDKVEIVIVMVNNVIVTKTAVYLIYDEPIDGKMDHCDSQDTNVIVGGDENECSSKIVSPQVESTDDSNQRQKRRKHWWR